MNGWRSSARRVLHALLRLVDEDTPVAPVSAPATRDPLTGLGDAVALAARLERLPSTSGETDVAVMVVDINGFRRINDSLGPRAGDELLVEFAGRLSACIADDGLAVRLGADDFVVVLDQPGRDAVGVAEDIVWLAAKPFHVAGTLVTLGASVGIARRTGGEEHSKLLREADLAMYLAKHGRASSIAVFEPDMQVAAFGRLAMESDLRRAVERNELTLAYQPILDLTTGTLVGVEALVRWDWNGCPIEPEDFLPVAEESGVIVSLGAWVVGEACAQLRQWDCMQQGCRLVMAVNVSLRQFERPGLIGTVADALQRSGIEPGRLVLELTESELPHRDDSVISTLRELHALGVRIAIDDFGTGYSSMARLRTFPIGEVKIDRSFVGDIRTGDAEAPMVAATIAMAQGLDLSVVAEGIETPAQLEFLRRHGCDQGQGWLLGRPAPPAAITDCLMGTASPLDLTGDEVTLEPSRG